MVSGKPGPSGTVPEALDLKELAMTQGVSKSKHRVFKRPNVGFCKQADFCGTSILNCLVLVCMLFCIKGNKKPVKCDRLVKS